MDRNSLQASQSLSASLTFLSNTHSSRHLIPLMHRGWSCCDLIPWKQDGRRREEEEGLVCGLEETRPSTLC